MKSICVFCGARSGYNKNFGKAATEFGRLLAIKGIELVYGGGSIGIMGEIAESVLKEGGKVTGVITAHLMDMEVGHTGISKMHIVETLQQRKELQIQISDAFIALPGGYGTMDEFFEILVHNQLHLINKPLGILNTDGFYNPLAQMLEHFTAEGFASQEQLNTIIIEEEPAILLERIREWKEAPAPIVID